MTHPTDDELEAMAVRLDIDDPWCQPLCYEAADMLRALSAERDREKAYADQSAINLDNALERAEAAEAERDEALNQLDSARHSVDVLEKRVGVFKAENARLREALTDMRDDKIAYRHASHFRRRAAVVLARHQKEKDT
jgi:hypothetical protein